MGAASASYESIPGIETGGGNTAPTPAPAERRQSQRLLEQMRRSLELNPGRPQGGPGHAVQDTAPQADPSGAAVMHDPAAASASAGHSSGGTGLNLVGGAEEAPTGRANGKRAVGGGIWRY